MKNRPTGYLLIISLGFVFAYCVYSPDEDFFKEIQPLDSADFRISLNSFFDDDTIYLEGVTTFSYSLGSSGIVQEVRVLLNDELIYTLYNKNGTFTITPTTGIYKLRVEFISTSGTGSLADQVGAELVKVWKEWVIDAYVETYPETPQITTSIENGFAVISWTPYTKTKFVGYELTMENTPFSFSKIFTDPTITSWVDSSYTGNFTRRYSILTKNEVSSSRAEVYLYGSNYDATLEATFNEADSTITVQTPKPTYYGPFLSYTIFENSNEVGQTTNVNQTSFTFKSNSVGVNYTSFIVLQSNVKTPASIYFNASKEISTAVRIRKFPQPLEKFTYNVDMNSVIGFWGSGNSGQLFTLDPISFDITRTYNIFNGPGFHIPYNGHFVYYSKPAQLIQLNLTTLEEKPFDAITTQFGSGPSKIYGSTPQIVSYTWFGPGGAGVPIYYYTCLYNMITNQYFGLHTESSLVNYVISDDGDFVNLKNTIYRVNNNSLTPIGNIPSNVGWIGFRADNCKEFIARAGSGVYIYDTNTMSLKRTIPGPNGAGFVTYDTATKSLILYSYDAKELYCINIDTGSIKTYRVNLPVVFGFIGGALILNSTDYVKIF